MRKRLEVSKIIGVVGENAGLYDRLTTREHLRFFGRLNGMSPASIKERTLQLFAMLDIDYGDRTCEKLSKGQKQKAAICREQDRRSICGDRPQCFVVPFAAIDRNASTITFADTTSRPLVGSSRIRTGGVWIRARQIAAFCF